jgi:hypothetical protein
MPVAPLHRTIKTMALLTLSSCQLGLTAALGQSANDPRDDMHSADHALEVHPNANVDEALFLVNQLEYLYASWPKDNDRKQVLDRLEEDRNIVTNLRQAIVADNLDLRIAKLYEDCLRLIDANETYLTNLGIIDQQAVEGAKHRALNIALNAAVGTGKGYFEGSSAQDIFWDVTINGLLSIAKHGWQVASQRQAAISSETQRLTDLTRATLDDAKSQAQILALRRGWSPGEADFTPLGGGSITDLMKNDSIFALIKSRPRDPFLVLRIISSQYNSTDSAREALAWAKLSVIGAQRVPIGHAYYDLYRLTFIGYAVDYALTVSALECGDYSNGACPSAAYALQLSRTCLGLSPSDSNGFGHAELARALAFSGRYSEAITAADAALAGCGKSKLGLGSPNIIV